MARLREDERAAQGLDPRNATTSPLAAAAIQAELQKKSVFLHELRTRAYGKVVVARRRSNGEVRVYRIAQANYGFPDLPYHTFAGETPLRLINRQSPVARLLVTTAVGDEIQLRVKADRGEWIDEDFEVVGVLHLERYHANELLPNYGNFKTVSLSHVDLAESRVVEDAADFFRRGVDTFVRALEGRGAAEEAREAVASSRARLSSRQLSDADIDTLLALNHLVSVGYRGRDDRDPISHFEETTYCSQVFIDEFQDFSETQLFLMAAQAHPKRRAVTMVGDLRQRLRTGREPRYEECFPRATADELEVAFLLENKRQTAELARFSHHFRKAVFGEDLADGSFDAQPRGPLPRLLEVPEDRIADAVFEEVRVLQRTQSVAVLCPDDDTAAALQAQLRDDLRAEFRETRHSKQADLTRRYFVHFTTALEAKGLELDAVVVAHLDRFDLDDPVHANACYVAVSRPRTSLSLVIAEGRTDRRLEMLTREGFASRAEEAP